MRIREITLQEVRMKLVDPFETSMDRTNVRRILLVQADVDGVIGWPNASLARPLSTVRKRPIPPWLILRDFLWPLIKGKEFASAAEVWDLLARVRGAQHGQGFTGSCRLGCRSQQKGVPLSKLIGAFAMRSRAASRSH